jgi:hypothetical protein
MNNKVLGSLALAGAPFFLLSSFLQPYFQFMHEQQFYGAWGLIYLAAWMCSIRGLQRLRATGKSTFGKVLIWIMMGALVLASLSNVYKIIAPGTRSPLFILLDSFWPLSNLLMLVVGITVAAAKRLKGWKRFIPLLVGLWFPVLVVCMNVFGRDGVTGTIAGVYSAVAWSLLAIVVYTTKEEPEVVYVRKPAYQLS